MLRLTVLEILVFLEGQNVGFLGSPGGTVPKQGDFVSGIDMYHHAKFRAIWCHRRRDICYRTEKKQQI